MKNRVIKIMSYILPIILLISMNVFSISGANTGIYETTKVQKITKGLDYIYKQVFTQDGWVDVHVLKLDIEEEQVAFKLLNSAQEYGLRDTMTDFAIQYTTDNEGDVVGGINGSFFNMSGSYSEPLGVSYEEEYGYAQHNYNVSANGAASLIQTNNGEFMMDYFGMSIDFENAEGRKMYFTGINKLDASVNPVIYNRLFADSSKRIDDEVAVYKLTVINNVITKVTAPNIACNIPDLKEGYIVTIPEEIADIHLPYFQEGTAVNLNINSTIDTSEIKYAISGGGKIIENGEIVQSGMIVEPTKRHPRSAVGITSDGKYLIAMVVDGRGSSIGATHDELASYLIDYNVTEAIHLDGGGSSTLLGRKLGYEEIEVFNSPSGISERAILNGIGFVSLAEPGPITTIEIIATTDIVFKNNPIGLSLIGYDDNYNPINIDSRKVLWSVEKGITGVWSSNTFTPSNDGDGVLKCYYNDLSASLNIKSLDSPIDLNVSPRIMTLDYNNSGEFLIKGLDNSGYEGVINNDDVVYTVDDPSIGTFINGVFISGAKAGITKIKLQTGSRWTTAYVVVGNEKQVMDSFESEDFNSRVYPDEVIGNAVIDEQVFYDTDMSYKFEYDFKSSPSPQAVYMMFENFIIQEPTDIISLQVLGNNSGHSLKGKIIDAKGQTSNITFSSEIDFEGWKELIVEVPSDLEYPIILDRIYVVALQSYGDFNSSINIDKMSIMRHINSDDLKFDNEGFISDEMMLQFKPSETSTVKIFGATAYRDRLLDNILLNKVYEKMNETNYGIFAGHTDIHEEKLNVNYNTWNNKYDEYSVEGVKFIELGTGEGGLRSTDYTQYDMITESLKTTSENIIVFIGNKNPLTSFEDSREGELLHEILLDHKNKTGKTIMYINASGYKTDVTIKDGIRYFDLSGLWYKIQDRYVNLNETFYSLDFYIDNNEIQYMFTPLFPTVEIME